MSFPEMDYPAADPAPIDTLEQYFDANGWASERLGDEEIITTVKGGWATYQLRALWRGDDRVLQIIAQADLVVPEALRAAAYETIGLINEQLWMGHFELWSADGAVLFRHASLLADDDADDGGDLSAAQAEILTEAAVEEYERYYPVFQLVLLAGQSPAEALAAALIETAGEA
ncbi:type III secretion system chaperone family protein [Sandarakinorhabdus rubra]|uniref:YbjN domain-containing protein n=1 Tax=Sandarakinorhabdus rubra TaxID=2672568 RepID=UPI001969E4D0|nr:YbjN domain-containing protein [Sandarakinorhabdus rubra]